MYISGLGTPYWYEWEIGLLECLKMMTNNEIKSVVLQSEDFQSLDDVVVNYNDGSIINIQVKHTDTNESFTYSTLNSGEPSMLKKWATEWQKQKDSHRIREIRIVTNRPWGTHKSDGKCSFKTFVDNVIPKLQNDFSYNSKKKEEAAACEWIKKQLDFLSNDVQDFLKILNFRKNGDLSEVDSQIKENISHILGTERKNIVEASSNNLLAKLSEWATSRRKRQEIYREDIYRALCASSKDLPKYDLSPEKPIF
jgi:hypothetical protein